jgi:8-oxo-dGTP diphosphatase
MRKNNNDLKSVNKDSNPVVAVNAIILDNNDRVLLTKRRDIEVWCLPGGMIESNETVSNALIREVKEEIGVDVKVVRLLGVYSCNNINSKKYTSKNSIIINVLAKITNGQLSVSEEVEEFGYFSATKLPEIIKSQIERIIDALEYAGEAVLK